MTEKLRLEVVDPRFFSIPLKQVEIETAPNTGRTYFVHKGKIIAVGAYAALTHASSRLTLDSERRLST